MTAPRDPRDEVVTEPVAPAQTERVREDRVVERQGWSPTIGPGLVVGALGALGVVVSLFMEWNAFGVHPDGIPVAFLGDDTTTSTSPSLLIALIPLAVLLLVGAVAPMGAALRLVGGIGTLIVVGLFAFQLNEAVDDADLGGALGTGWYVAVISSFLALASGFVPEAWTRRSEVIRSDTRRTERDPSM